MNDTTWREIYTNSSKECVEEMTKKKDEIVKTFSELPFFLSPDKCDAIPMIYFQCFLDLSYVVRLL
jgi:hypothetical protein